MAALNWNKEAPTSLKFDGTDGSGTLTNIAVLTKVSANASQLTITTPDGSTIGALNIPGDFSYAKALFEGIAAGI